MDPRLRSLLTLGTLCALLVVAGAWGLSALTQPFPDDDGPSVCADRTFAEGERVRRGDVVVSVLNAGSRNGLAGLTLNLFEEAGFAPGQEGNTTGRARVEVAQIWTDDPRSPAVRLVASHLGEGVRVVRREPTTAGVQVVVGDGFEDLVAGDKFVRADAEAVVCGPVAG